MENLKIVIAGGTGFIGHNIAKHLSKKNSIVILTTKSLINNHQTDAELFYNENIKYVFWEMNQVGAWVNELENSNLLINLAGKSVNCRYTPRNKMAILNSRVDTTKALGVALKNLKNPPKLWINSSSSTIYKHSETVANDEYSKEFNNDFSVQVCKAWEETFYAADTPETNKVALRMAIVFGKGGVLIPYTNLCKWGLGGMQGNGRQMFSWIHIDDLLSIFKFLYSNNCEGTYNAAAPNPIDNKSLMKVLRDAVGVKFGLPAPKLLLKLGAIFLGTETELVLKSRYVFPAKLMNEDFKFKYSDIKMAINNLIQK